jgi:hypothetical protein
MMFSKWLGHVLAVGVCVAACVTSLSAQDQQLTRPKVEAKAMFGGVVFEPELDHTAVGGAVRVYVTKRISIEPEFLYMRNGANDQDFIVQPNVAFDITDPTKRFVAYAIGGAGVLHHKGLNRSVNTWTASAGGGVKIFLTNRLFVSPEFRLGSEPTVRATVNVGYVFAGRRPN